MKSGISAKESVKARLQERDRLMSGTRAYESLRKATAALPLSDEEFFYLGGDDA